ncbi:MAG: anti-sigma factor [Chloroflexota bacterium]|nr:anti-sigma factor [Chloroflexota bacterium]
MTCDRRLLSSYRDAQLSADERYLVDRHLRECPECRRDLQGMVRIGQVIRSLPWEPAPASIGREVRRKIAEREAARRRPLPLGGYARAFAPAAAFASVAVALLMVLRPGVVEGPLGLSSPAVVASAPASAASRPVASQSAAPGDVPVPPTGRPGNPISDVARATASGAASASLPDKTAAPSAPTVPSLASTLTTPDAEPALAPPISRLIAARPSLGQQLGQPQPGSRTVTLLEQSFQGGLAIWRSDTREIYVLRREGGTWAQYKDQSRPGAKITVDVPPPPGALVPAGGFGALWLAKPEVKSRLGWAVYEPRGSGGTIQAFEHGLVVWSPHGLLYVLTEDGRWRTFADASPA